MPIRVMVVFMQTHRHIILYAYVQTIQDANINKNFIGSLAQNGQRTGKR